jgi:hypothetical protein
MIKHRRLLFFVSAILISTLSCKKEKNADIDPNCVYSASGRFMGNPYEVGNLSERTGLRINKSSHYYIRVWITDSDAFKEWEAIGDFLPFDRRYEPQANGFHRLDSGKEKGIWIYGMVPASAQLPGAYEVLEKCYLPEPGDIVWNMLDKGIDAPEARNGVPIRGKLTFFDPISQQYMPLSGVRVIIQDGGRTLQSVTQADGSFSNPNKIFVSRAEVLLRFEDPQMEIRTLDLDNLGGILTPNILSFGMINQCAFENLQLEIGSNTTNATLQASAASVSYTHLRAHET